LRSRRSRAGHRALCCPTIRRGPFDQAPWHSRGLPEAVVGGLPHRGRSRTAATGPQADALSCRGHGRSRSTAVNRVIWVCAGFRREKHRWKYVLVRTSRYLNNVVEQDHRAIKGRCRPMLSFKSYRSAALTLAGLELAHRIRKRQFKFGSGRWSFWSLKKQWDTALA